MQAVAFKDKRRGSAGNKAADDPNYENITFTFKNQNQPKGSHSPPKNKVPAESRPPSDTAQGHHWLPKAMMSLNTFLTLSCMVLLAVVLVKNSEMSRELVVLKEELWNVSTSVQEHQEEQKTQWGNVEQRVTAAKQSIDTVMRNVQEGNPKRRQLATVPNIDEVKKTLQEILSILKTSKPTRPLPGYLRPYVGFHGHVRPTAAALRHRLARPAHTPVPSLRLRTPPPLYGAVKQLGQIGGRRSGPLLDKGISLIREGGGMEARFTRGKSALLERALARPRTEVSLSAFALLFSELVQHCQSRVFSVAELQARLAALGRQVGARVLDALVAREKGARRETKVLGALLFVKGAVWKALFGKEADKLEQANDDARTFYIIEREPLINTYISVPKENSTLNCASFTAGIVEAVLTHSGFPAKVTAHWHKGTTLMIKFEEAVIARDRALEGR
ncbi:hypothetical protein R6Z07F_006639 [Ovis aries]